MKPQARQNFPCREVSAREPIAPYKHRDLGANWRPAPRATGPPQVQALAKPRRSQLAEGIVTAQGSLRENLTPKIADQVEYIVCAFQREEIEIGVEKVDGGVDYMYAEGQLLVRDEYLDRVLDIIRPLEEPDPERAEPDPERAEPGPERAEPGRVQRVIAGVVLLTLRGTRLTVRDALIAIDRRVGGGVGAADHGVSL